MASAELKDAINRNIRRNLGVFEVPGYLFQGDPVDKFGLDCRANVMLRARRDGLSTAQPSEWWRRTIDRERRTAPSPAQPPPAQLMPAQPMPATPSRAPLGSEPPMGPSWGYYPAGITPQGPGGGPALVYMPCLLPSVPPPYPMWS